MGTVALVSYKQTSRPEPVLASRHLSAGLNLLIDAFVHKHKQG